MSLESLCNLGLNCSGSIASSLEGESIKHLIGSYPGPLIVCFCTMDYGVDNLKRNLLVDRLFGDQPFDP